MVGVCSDSETATMGHDSRALADIAGRAPGTNRTECTVEELRESDRRRADAAAKKREQAVDRRRYVVRIQAMWRGYCVRDTIRQAQEHKAYLAVMLACMRIQRRFRNYLQLKAEREISEREERQMLWAVWVIQSVSRCFGPEAELARRKEARATEIRNLLMARSAVVIQKCWRGHLQRRLAIWLRGADARRHLSSARIGDTVPAGDRLAQAESGRGSQNQRAHVEAPETARVEVSGLAESRGEDEDVLALEGDVEADAEAARRERHMAAAAKARASQLASRKRGRGR
eukprot:COSAG02_NODE_15131_length_1201_cov_1.313975_1_plen_287_part_00